MVPSIECRDLFLRLADEEVLIIDCREHRDPYDDPYEEGPLDEERIPGALRMSLFELARHANILPDDELIVLCGDEPDGSDARQAYRLLRFQGKDGVCLEGGLRAWVASGYPTERHERPETLAAESPSDLLRGLELSAKSCG